MTLLIHAANIYGLGARMVVSSLLTAMSELPYDTGFVQVVLPDIEFWRDFHINRDGWEISLEKRDFRLFQRSISRVKECIFPPSQYNLFDHVLTLGDIPLRVKGQQTVLIHQPLIISPKINKNTEKGRFSIIRSIFRQNCHWAKNFVLQSDLMASYLAASYPELKSRIYVISQPPPSWLKEIRKINATSKNVFFRVMYPASNYPHKNHKLIQEIAMTKEHGLSIKLFLTISETEFSHQSDWEWIKCIGNQDPADMIRIYQEIDAIFFPSLQESYGLPLLEAMTLDLIVICSDLPYARWLCGDEAIYFDPLNPDSAWDALVSASRLHQSGWRPNWTKALAKIPRDWHSVADSFWQLIS